MFASVRNGPREACSPPRGRGCRPDHSRVDALLGGRVKFLYVVAWIALFAWLGARAYHIDQAAAGDPAAAGVLSERDQAMGGASPNGVTDSESAPTGIVNRSEDRLADPSPRSESAIPLTATHHQRKPLRWWVAKTRQNKRDANKRQLTIFRQNRENAILRKKIEWQLERQIGNRSHWLCIHRGERGAAGWATNTGNGYFGGLQMNYGFMRTYGPELLRSKGTADKWSMEEQMMVAERARASGRGYWPWPNTARACGLL